MSVSTGIRQSATDEVLASVAHRTTALVGDGCIVRVGGPDGLEVIALEHVEAKTRDDLAAALESCPAPRNGWLTQSLERQQSVRLPDQSAESLKAAGLPPDCEVADVMVVPMPSLGAVIVALRDRWSEPYKGSHRQEVERIAAEAESAASAERLDRRRSSRNDADPASYGLVEATSAGLWVVDESGSTVFVNGPASEMVGAPAADLIGRPISDFLGRGSQRRRGGFYGSEVIERPLMRVDGEVLWLLSSSRPLRQDDFGSPCVLYTLMPFTKLHDRDVNLRLRLARTEALLELAESAGAGAELDALLQAAVDLIRDQLDVEMAGVGRFDLEGMLGWPLATSGWPADAPAEGDGQPVSMVERSATAAALRSGEPVLVWDYTDQSIYERDPVLTRLDVRSAAVVPFAGGKAAVAAHSPRPGAIDGDGLNLLETVARLLAPHWPDA